MFKRLRQLISPTKEPIIVVSGLPRSGTSMMMKMLEAGGLETVIDGIRTADSDNPKGYYEFERVKQLDKGDTAWLPEAQGKVVKIISALLKFLPANYNYKIIFMRRHMSEILASQRKMLINRNEEPDAVAEEQMAKFFTKHLQENEQWMRQQPNITFQYFYYHELLADPERQVAKLNEFMGNQLDSQKMAQVISPDLYRNRK